MKNCCTKNNSSSQSFASLAPLRNSSKGGGGAAIFDDTACSICRRLYYYCFEKASLLEAMEKSYIEGSKEGDYCPFLLHFSYTNNNHLKPIQICGYWIDRREIKKKNILFSIIVKISFTREIF